MLVSDYASLPENKSGFWIQKQYGEIGQCSYLVFHQGMTELCDFISEAKKKLSDRYVQKVALSNVARVMYSRAMNRIASIQWGLMTGRSTEEDQHRGKVQSESDYTWLKHCSPELFK